MEYWNSSPGLAMGEAGQPLLAGKGVSSLVDLLALGGKNSLFSEIALSSGGLALGKVSVQFFNIGHCSL